MIELKFYEAGRTGIDFKDESRYQLLSVSGLDPVSALLNMSTAVGEDGTRFISSKLNNRNIVANFAINGDTAANRHTLYSEIRPKSQVMVEVASGTRSVTIQGYVESVTCNAFAKGVRAQISVICPDPWFIGAHFSPDGVDVDGGFEFDVENFGDAPAPFVLNFRYQGRALIYQITCVKNGAEIGRLNVFLDEEIRDPNSIEIDSEAKEIRLIPYSGEPSSLIRCLDANAEFFDLPVGESTLKVQIQGPYEATQYTLDFDELYGGV